MTWLKENWLKFIVLTLVVFIAGIYVENSFRLYDRLTSTNETKLLDRFNQYSNMIEVGLCQEAFDEFITKGSKERKGENFFAHCNYRKEDWHNIKIQTIVFSRENRADIKYTYDLDSRNYTHQDYLNCIKNSVLFLCEHRAPEIILTRETVETWFIEDGKWKRDY